MIRKRITYTAVALALAAGAAVAFAISGPGGHGPGGRGRLDPRRVADYLQLSEEQRADARELFEARREEVRPLFEAQRQLHEQLRALLDDPTATDAAVGQLVKQIHANREAMGSAREEAEAAFAALLTPEQQAKLDQLEGVMEGLGLGKRHGRGPRR